MKISVNSSFEIMEMRIKPFYRIPTIVSEAALWENENTAEQEISLEKEGLEHVTGIDGYDYYGGEFG
ncbi:hypothetical protein LXL04_028812 [Taraxacum kok-saghyz]